MGLLENFCRSSFGGSLDQLSALAGYALLQDLVTPTHVFKGGNPAIARALTSKVSRAGAERCLKNAFVWKIEIKDGSASVVYSLADGSVHRVDCKHVIVATPPLVSSRTMKGIPDLLRADLFKFKYCAYLVANLLMKEKLFKGKYDCFVGSANTFADLTVAEAPYILTNTYKPSMGSVLTVYQPYAWGTDGRSLLFAGDREQFASSIADQVEKLVPGFMKSIEEICLTRWGHALAIVGPNYFSHLAKIHAAQADASFTLAHSSIFGWPAAESAIRAGKTAAARALKL
jgi:protoporphyrinogen oxidase